MTNYKGFAVVYDELMDAPYEKWGKYISKILKKEKAKLVLDLGCGTGTMAIILSRQGFDMIGVDNSEDMLAAAYEKSFDSNQNILFLKQDMQKLDLFGTVDAVISVCDCLNYILTPEELGVVFKRVRLFLNPGGVFIFDMNTEYKFKEVMSNNSFEGESKIGARYEWDNNYNHITKINEYRVQFQNNNDEEPFTEIHNQRAYSINEVTNILTKAGFNEIDIFDDYTKKPPKSDSTRITYIVR